MTREEMLTTIEILCTEHGKLNAIVDASFDGIFEINKKLQFTFVNPILCKMFQIEYETYKKYNFLKVVKSADIKKALKQMFDGEKKLSVLYFEYLSESKKKKHFELKMMRFDLRDAPLVVGIVRDRTEIIRAVKNREYYIATLFTIIKEMKIETKDTIYSLAKLVEIHDHSTGKHLERIEHYARALAQQYYSIFKERDVHLTKKYIEDIAIAAVLHDIGKVRVPDSILLKPSQLTDEEYEKVKKHTLVVGEALNSFKGKKDILSLGREIAMSHHEKWDGTGYPAGLYGEKIPLSARLIALCDVYDALVSNRPYKKAVSHEEAVKIITGEKGKTFDPAIVDVFMKIHARFNEIKARFNDHSE
ncbi:MAG: HD domain-containing protein [Spirochaetales bacterium]|nr:HD domain-containing protein [Spirochaetales bacterium]